MGTLTKKDGGENGTKVVTHGSVVFNLTGAPIPKDKRRYVRETIPKKENSTKITTSKK